MTDTNTRMESDSIGAIAVPIDKLWGAQTQRSLTNFRIGEEIMPRKVTRALGLVKLAAAKVNAKLGRLKPDLAKAIIQAAEEVAQGTLDSHFPLVVWQTGSGTQSNMNANEVIAARANTLLGGKPGDKSPVHPNDHVNRSQSSNDSFPTAMHIAAAETLNRRLVPALVALADTLEAKAALWSDIVKIGRTHLQDATPLTLGQETRAWAAQARAAAQGVERTAARLFILAQGGTAVGTGLNAPEGFAQAFAQEIAAHTGLPFLPHPHPFEGIAAHDALIEAGGGVNAAAMGCFKIASDIRLLASGPRCGFGELSLPANEPGSSIMPGKVNPTQCEALTMVCAQAMGDCVTISFAGSQGHLQLNAFKPVMIYALLRASDLLADALESFRTNCLEGMEPNTARITEHLEGSLMLVTALAPTIGYDAAAQVAKKAHAEGLSLRDAALASGVSAQDYDAAIVPSKMVSPDKG